MTSAFLFSQALLRFSLLLELLKNRLYCACDQNWTGYSFGCNVGTRTQRNVNSMLVQ